MILLLSRRKAIGRLLLEPTISILLLEPIRIWGSITMLLILLLSSLLLRLGLRNESSRLLPSLTRRPLYNVAFVSSQKALNAYIDLPLHLPWRRSCHNRVDSVGICIFPLHVNNKEVTNGEETWQFNSLTLCQKQRKSVNNIAMQAMLCKHK